MLTLIVDATKLDLAPGPAKPTAFGPGSAYQTLRSDVLTCPASSILVTGYRGTGKSTIIETLEDEFQRDGCRVVFVKLSLSSLEEKRVLLRKLSRGLYDALGRTSANLTASRRADYAPGADDAPCKQLIADPSFIGRWGFDEEKRALRRRPRLTRFLDLYKFQLRLTLMTYNGGRMPQGEERRALIRLGRRVLKLGVAQKLRSPGKSLLDEVKERAPALFQQLEALNEKSFFAVAESRKATAIESRTASAALDVNLKFFALYLFVALGLGTATGLGLLKEAFAHTDKAAKWLELTPTLMGFGLVTLEGLRTVESWKRETSAQTEIAKTRLADDEIAEHDLQMVLQGLTEFGKATVDDADVPRLTALATQMSRPLQRVFQDLRAELEKSVRSEPIRVVFVLDELDKVESDEALLKLLGVLKPLLLSGDALFLAVLGQRMIGKLAGASLLDDSPITSLFSRNVHVRLASFQEFLRFFEDLVAADPLPKDNPSRQIAVHAYIRSRMFRSNGVFRRFIGLVREDVHWSGQSARLLIAETPRHAGAMFVEADFARAVEFVTDAYLSDPNLPDALRDFYVMQLYLAAHRLYDLVGEPFMVDSLISPELAAAYEHEHGRPVAHKVADLVVRLVDRLAAMDRVVPATSAALANAMRVNVATALPRYAAPFAVRTEEELALYRHITLSLLHQLASAFGLLSHLASAVAPESTPFESPMLIRATEQLRQRGVLKPDNGFLDDMCTSWDVAVPVQVAAPDQLHACLEELATALATAILGQWRQNSGTHDVQRHEPASLRSYLKRDLVLRGNLSPDFLVQVRFVWQDRDGMAALFQDVDQDFAHYVTACAEQATGMIVVLVFPSPEAAAEVSSLLAAQEEQGPLGLAYLPVVAEQSSPVEKQLLEPLSLRIQCLSERLRRAEEFTVCDALACGVELVDYLRSPDAPLGKGLRKLLFIHGAGAALPVGVQRSLAQVVPVWDVLVRYLAGEEHALQRQWLGIGVTFGVAFEVATTLDDLSERLAESRQKLHWLLDDLLARLRDAEVEDGEARSLVEALGEVPALRASERDVRYARLLAWLGELVSALPVGGKAAPPRPPAEAAEAVQLPIRTKWLGRLLARPAAAEAVRGPEATSVTEGPP